MINFLIIIDKPGNIEEIKWCSPAYIIPNVGESFFELFSNMDIDYLNELKDKECISEEFCCFNHSCTLKEHGKTIKLYFLSMENVILVFGADEKRLSDGIPNDLIDELIYKFMKVSGDTFLKEKVLNTESARIQFENIQSINSELINTQRMLHKANSKLGILNKDLNNRLVKDHLTGLVSRYQYSAEIEHVISINPGKLGVFTYIDIDNFKSVNDDYGHSVGDQYLIEFSNRLITFFSEDTVKIRISGDEFGLFIYGLEKVEKDDIEEIWKRLEKYIMSNPFKIDGNHLGITISAGMAIYGRDTFNIYEMIDYADYAMYRAKKTGKSGFHIYNPHEYKILKG